MSDCRPHRTAPEQRTPVTPSGPTSWPRVVVPALILAGLVGCGLVGCGPGRSYARPEVSVPADHLSTTATTSGPGLVRWWMTFNDPLLDRLVVRAAAGAKDLHVAVARIREAKSTLGVLGSRLGPQIDAAGSALRQQTSEHANREATPNDGKTSNRFQAGLEAGWEPDLFGTTTVAIAAGDIDVSLAEAERDGVLLAVIGTTVRAYLDFRANQQRLVLAEAAAAAAADVAALRRDRSTAGIDRPELAFASAAEADLAAAAVPTAKAAVALARHRLAAICGEAPNGLETLLAETPQPSLPVVPDHLPIGLPAELLRRRPDLRASERRLAAIVARVGVAEADLYPQFSVGGSLALQSASLTNLATADSLLWSLGPSVRWPILASGRIRASITVAETKVDQTLASYERAVVEALREVADGAVIFGAERDRAKLFAAAAATAERTARLAADRHTAGLADRLESRAAQLASIAAADRALAARQAQAQALVALAQAVGGGWEDPELQRAWADPARTGVNSDLRP